MQSEATTVDEYLDGLSTDRRAAISAVRQVILSSIPKEVEETMSYGAIGYVVPHSIYPNGYHCDPTKPLPYIGLASQKNYMSVYLFCIYVDADLRDRFIESYKATGKKLDIGAGCIRFKKLENLPLDLLERTIREMTLSKFLKQYEVTIPNKSKRKPESKK